jgi:Tetracyclin repressor-like, C-terminal domain
MAVPDETERSADYSRKVAAIAEAQGAGAISADPEAARLFYAVIALTAWCFAAPKSWRCCSGPPPTTCRPSAAHWSRWFGASQPTEAAPPDESRPFAPVLPWTSVLAARRMPPDQAATGTVS